MATLSVSNYVLFLGRGDNTAGGYLRSPWVLKKMVADFLVSGNMYQASSHPSSLRCGGRESILLTATSTYLIFGKFVVDGGRGGGLVYCKNQEGSSSTCS